MREDWIECKFDDVFFTTSGGTPSRRNENYYIGNIPWIKSGELKSNVITEAEEFISEEAVKNSSAKVFPAGTILLALYGATIGKIAILGIPAATNQAICGIFETPFVFSKYAYYYLVNKKSYLIKQGIGGAQPNISQTILKNLDFSLPPLPEQRAIVKKLESLFSSLDAGVADLKKAQQQLKIYRQAVLKKAFEESDGFCRIGEYFSFLGGGTPSKQNKDYWNGNINWASIKDIKGDILNNTIDYITEDGLQNSSSNLAEKDEVILATRINPGKTIISNIRTAINQDLKVIKPLQKCDHKYVHYLFKSIEHKCLKVSSGTTVLGISLPNLKEIEIPFEEDINKQAQIVKHIESRLSVCDSIEQNIKESLEKAEALRQSILKKAFAGNLLTAQELAECKQAADYEPASVLLERIKAKQNKATAKPSKKKVAQPLVVAITETSVAKISADIHAGLIAKVIKIHEENPASIDNLSHIKCEKIAHLVEYHLQIPLGRQPVKDAAGPDDYPHLKKIEHRAKMANYFAIQKKEIGYSYSSAKNSDKAIEKFQSTLSDEKNRQLDNLIALFLKFDLEVSEIIATTYAGWNNLILSGNANPSDEEIVYESRENWSERKLKITRERFFKAIEWMRKNEIVPTGYGAVVPFPKKKN
ncbi:restriction endonuclease subunit S [Chryseobacterium sp. 09-1422]|uniref:Restriction endonuclease subunit S n=1 Tax=Chryseobacterium kimseyorum TaxID=2984028 RepID=A0ABT3HYH3_9FLAO|nr:restriction endonuclease subunit S [Chryseobacterium kimseyorum]MCW3168816.1 restriction endonuclease subunit S [Chryseobacterium kimseyorum]